MALMICDGGKLLLLDALRATLDGLDLRLFVNDHTPASVDTITAYTEASFPGYGPIALGSWASPFLTADTPKRAESDEVVRTFTQTSVPAAPQTVYGYYVTNLAGALVYAEYGPADGVLMNTASHTYSVLPKMQLSNIGG